MASFCSRLVAKVVGLSYLLLFTACGCQGPQVWGCMDSGSGDGLGLWDGPGMGLGDCWHLGLGCRAWGSLGPKLIC